MYYAKVFWDNCKGSDISYVIIPADSYSDAVYAVQKEYPNAWRIEVNIICHTNYGFVNIPEDVFSKVLDYNT